VIRLGHISYSNCYPVHALLLEGGGPADVEIVTGTPAQLNRALAEGAIDVAPCSSIEYARHAGRYRILPDLTIAAAGPVQSILLECAHAPHELGDRVVYVPTASATSVVLLRVLLELRWGARARLQWFEQEADADPFARGAAAALWIGDVALQRRTASPHMMLDLGEAWMEWTGLPFAFAVWQTGLDAAHDAALNRLHHVLLDSLAWFQQNRTALADRHAPTFGRSAAQLLQYWDSLRYRMDAQVEEGLLRFFACAARLGEAPVGAALQFVPLDIS
jgi:chorismate dehydratase